MQLPSPERIIELVRVAKAAHPNMDMLQGGQGGAVATLTKHVRLQVASPLSIGRAEVRVALASLEVEAMAQPDDSPSKGNLLMMARTASVESPGDDDDDDLVVDVRPAQPPNTPTAKSPVQERLEAWSPMAASLADSDAEEIHKHRMQAAQKRKQASLSAKTSTLAKNNDKVRAVGEQQKGAASTAHAEMRDAAETKQVKANTRRTSLLQETSANSSAHVEHAKQVAAEHKATEAALIEEKKKGAEKVHAAASRRASLLSELQAKAAAEVLKAKALAQAKKEQTESLRETAETKLAAHEYRRDEAIESKLTKLEEQAEHAKQVRRNKGTTITDEDNALKQKAAEKKPEQFDMLPERKASSPHKSAVQIRLEAQAEKDPTSPEDVDKKMSLASARKQSLQADKTAALAMHSQKVTQVQQSQKTKEEEDAVSRRATLDECLQVASARKKSRLAAESEKAGVDYIKAVNLSGRLADEAGSVKKESLANLDNKLQNADRRRASLMSSQQADAAADVFKAKALAQAKKEQTESLRETAETKLAAHEYRRDEAIESKLTKLEEQAEHAKQVRRNKGTTITDEDNALKQKAAEKKPEQFDMLPERKASSPHKSAVQIRLEAQAEKDPTSPEDVDKKMSLASARKQSLQADKTAALAMHSQKVTQVQQSQKTKEEEDAVSRRATLDESLHVASARKESRLAAESEKAGVDYIKAGQLSARKKETMGSAKKESQGSLDNKLQNADRRRMLFMDEQTTKGTTAHVRTQAPPTRTCLSGYC